MWEEKWHKASPWRQKHIHIHTGQRRYGQVKLLLRVNGVSQITWGILFDWLYFRTITLLYITLNWRLILN